MALAISSCGGSPAPTPTSDQTAAARTAAQAPATSPPPAREQAPLITPSMRAEFASVLRRAGASDGAVALQALDGTSPTQVGEFASPYAWSSIKPVIVAALLKLTGGPSGLNAQQRAQARAALTASDNDAAMALFQSLAARRGGVGPAASAMTDVLRKAGDSTTRVSTVGRAGFSPYGQTLWEPGAQARFVSALARGCLLDRSSTAYVLGLMNEVVPDQRWGFGTLASVSALKGGWGPDPGGPYVVRQIGLFEPRRGRPLAFAAAVRAGDGSFEAGTRSLKALADWLQGARLRPAAPKNC